MLHECVLCVYMIQFCQHDELQQQLLDTGNARILFMCDGDNFLGASYDTKVAPPTFHGKNWLGKSLMKLKQKLQVLVSYCWLFFIIASTSFSSCQENAHVTINMYSVEEDLKSKYFKS